MLFFVRRIVLSHRVGPLVGSHPGERFRGAHEHSRLRTVGDGRGAGLPGLQTRGEFGEPGAELNASHFGRKQREGRSSDYYNCESSLSGQF